MSLKIYDILYLEDFFMRNIFQQWYSKPVTSFVSTKNLEIFGNCSGLGFMSLTVKTIQMHVE